MGSKINIDKSELWTSDPGNKYTGDHIDKVKESVYFRHTIKLGKENQTTKITVEKLATKLRNLTHLIDLKQIFRPLTWACVGIKKNL